VPPFDRSSVTWLWLGKFEFEQFLGFSLFSQQFQLQGVQDKNNLRQSRDTAILECYNVPIIAF
jgi:hypothetical protein